MSIVDERLENGHRFWHYTRIEYVYATPQYAHGGPRQHMLRVTLHCEQMADGDSRAVIEKLRFDDGWFELHRLPMSDCKVGNVNEAAAFQTDRERVLAMCRADAQAMFAIARKILGEP